VATVRVVDDHDAHHTGRFFADTEFDLAPLRRLPGRCMEVRDFCVHPDYRRSPAAKLLWTGISRLLDLNNIEYVLTTCSVSISRGDHYLRGVLDFLQGHHAVSDELRVRPRIPYCTSDSEPVDIIRLPRRLRTYLSMGGKLCGLPYWDAMGNEARLLMMIQHTRAARAFLQRFTRVA
jgi:putative hemolysin